MHGLASVVNRGDDGKIADKTEAAHAQVEELVSKKAQAEEKGLERLAELQQLAEDALSFLCERHAALHAYDWFGIDFSAYWVAGLACAYVRGAVAHSQQCCHSLGAVLPL